VKICDADATTSGVRRPLIRRALRRGLRMARPSCAAAVAILFLLKPAHALGPVDASVGLQYRSGVQDQTTWSPTVELESDLKICTASLAASHFDDNQSGSAWGVTGGLAFPVTSKVQLSVAGTGFAGDSASGAWRVKAGPEFALEIKDQTLGIFYAHYDGLGVTADALSAEFGTPLTPTLSGDASVSLQNTDGTTGEDASAGLSWKPVDAFELDGDVGLSNNASDLTVLLPSRRALRTAKGNKSGSTTTVNAVGATALVGIQVHF
jgi:hypothetical protein